MLIAHILNNATPGDAVLLLAYEQEMVETIYSVLLAPKERMHTMAKTNALKVVHLGSYVMDNLVLLRIVAFK